MTASTTAEMLPVMEHFYTLQGEGVFQGQAAYFIRLGGCDVGCAWCDVKESWPIDAHPKMRVDELANLAAAHPARLAVITGGEPLMHDLRGLLGSLKEAGFQTNIETSGAHPLRGEVDWLCLSPKRYKKPLPEIYEKANELKVIIYAQSDFEWAEQEASKVSEDCTLILQPEWGRREKMLPRMIKYVQENPKWRLSLQTHKYLQIP